MTTTQTSISYSAKSAAKRAALKQGLEPAEFRIEPTDSGRFAIRLIEALKPAPTPPKHGPSPAAQGIAAAKADDAEPNPFDGVELAPEAPEAAEAADIFGIKKPNKKHFDILAAAKRGQRPIAPDLSAPAHDYYRRFLIQIQDAIGRGDQPEIQRIADKMRPKAYCSSRTPIRAYGLLSLIALRA